MRTVASEIGFRERRKQVGMGARAAALRKAHRRTLALELLETRVLLATLPAIAPNPNAPVPIDLAQPGSAPGGGTTNPGDAAILNPTTNTGTIENESSPTIAIDPNNPQKLVAVYTTTIRTVTTTTTTATSTIEGAYSTNQGLSWTSFNVAPVKTIDPQTSAAFLEITNATVAFDHNDNFYVASQENNFNDETGAVFLERYSFTGASPSTDQLASGGASKIIYGPWNVITQTTPPLSEVLNLSLAVDSDVSSFTDPTNGSWSVKDANTGSVYVALGTSAPVNATTNNYSIQLLYSSATSLGATFSSAMTVSTETTADSPQLTVEQGGPGSGVTNPGQVAIVWDNFATAAPINGGAIETRVFTPNTGSSPPTGTFGPEVIAFSSIPSTATTSGFSVVSGTPQTGTGNFPDYPVTFPTPANYPVSPTFGVGPSPVIASDNTLGAYSQFQGELYVAFVGHSLATATTTVTSNSNPISNTDIYLLTSTNGGLSWSNVPVQVDQDSADTDGFSEANNGTVSGGAPGTPPPATSGRTQFMPSIAVDQTTGTLVVSWFDTRNDAANARYATYITTSIDGGQTFAPDTFANAPDTAFNTITQQNVILGPVQDDQSTGDPNADVPVTTPALPGYAFGNHQGLAVYAGHVYAAWSGDESGGNNESMRLNIMIAPMVIAAGPRVVSSTMGEATPLAIPLTTPGGPTMINTRDPVTGVPQFDGFFVTFDRYVNPATFNASEIVISYLAPGASSTVEYGTGPNMIPLTNLQIISQDARPSPDGVKSFLVTFNALEGVGTYSYAIGPGVSDRIRTASATGVLASSGNEMDQNADGQPGELTLDQYAVPRPLNGTPFQSPYDPTTLPIIVPGPSIISTAALDANGNPIPEQTDGENLALNTAVTGVQVTFDRDMRVGSFTPSDILSLVGPIGPVAGPFTIQVVPGSLRVFNILFATPQTLSGSYVVTISPNIYSVVNSDTTRTTGDPIDADGTAALVQLRGGSTANGTTTFTASNNTVTTIGPGQTIQSLINIGSDFTISSPVTLSLNITFPTDPALVVTLLVIDPNNSSDDVTIPLFSRIGSGLSTANFTNTTFSDLAALPIQDASAPFSATYQVETGLGPGGKTVTLDSLSGRSAKATYILQISNTSSVPTDMGQLNDWSISMGAPVLNDGLGQNPETVPFRIFVMDPTDTQSLSTWTAVGPASSGSPTGVLSDAGAVTATAVDPSDPSGNTVYIGAANGGIWKTTDFLTTSPLGPTWIPLTDFGPTNAVNIGSIAIFPRNNDPSQSIIIAGTGDPNGTGTGHGLPGVGFLRSEDGGATWQLLDSTVNTEADGITPLPINGPSPTSGLTRNHTFVGSYVYNVTFDPNLSPSGGVIVYAAVNGPTASSAASGLWRSMDGGNTWTLLKAGQATSVSLDLYSGTKDVNGNPIGNATTLFVAFGNDPNGNDGVWKSTNFGQSFALMTGNQGDPEVQDTNTNPASTVPVSNDAVSPNGTNGRIILAKPNLIPSTSPNAVIENQLYEGWLYALVVNTNDTINGLYVTKDAGLNWTKVAIPTATTVEGGVPGTPTNNAADTALNIVGNYGGRSTSNTPQGNADLVMTMDPTNPNIVYIGGAGPDSLIRVNITTLQDLYSFDLDSDTADGGKLTSATTAAATLVNATTPPTTFRANIGSPSTNPTLNLLRNPTNPLGGSGTIFVANTASLNNSGAGATWIPETTLLGDMGGDPFEYDLIAVPDPLTGGTRLIAANNSGVWTGVLGSNGQLIQNIGDVSNDSVASTSADVPVVTYTRNGNLQIGQFYYGAVQPNSVAAQVAGALLYVQSANTDGAPYSAPDLLTSGNLEWDTTTPLLAPNSELLSSTPGGFVTTDPAGSGTVFQYQNPQTGVNTNFFKVDGLGQTNGLATAGGPNPDPQWPNIGPLSSSAGTPFGQFAVNPVDDQKILIGSDTGIVYATSNQGDTWTPVASAALSSGFDGTYPQALAYGAPQPDDPTGANDTFYYAGTTGGHIYVTFTGGGGAANWTNITNGALNGNTSPILQIITNPNRGSNAAYAITTNGVFYIADSNQSDPVPTAMKQWVKVTGNLLTTLSNAIFDNPLIGSSVLTSYLTSLAVDWRYQIPNNPTVTATATAQLGSINGVSTGALGLIVIDNGGQGYTSANPPTVTISGGGGGSGATGAAVVNSSGVITSISFTGVLSIDLSNGGGTGYSAASPPAVTITGGGGSGAIATAVVTNETVNGVVTGVVTQIIVNNPGSGYTSAPTIGIGAPGTGGTAATAVATIASAGANYTSPPTITIAPPPPALTHPVLYVSGNAGVYQSIDGGQTWALFPSSAANLEGAPQNGGYLPNVKVTNLGLSIGAVNPTTGANVTQPGDSNLLTATTDGQGVFAIRLGPMIFPNSATQPSILGLDPSSVTGTVSGSAVTRVADPIIDGYSEQTTSGSDVYVSLYDMSNPSKPVLIGGFNPASEATATAAINTLTGTVTSINVTNDGFNYTTAPTVVLTGGGFTSPATATAVMGTGANADKVVSITFTGGAGYTYAPTVSIALPPPSGNVTTNANGFFSIPINAGYFTQDGTKTIGIQATDAAGEIGNMQLLKFVLDTQPPTAPAPTLDPVSDTGTFNNDNITNDNNAPVPPGNSYDAVSNFSLLSNPTPNGVWSYFYEQPAGSAPIQMTTTGTLVAGVVEWTNGQTAPNASAIERNTTNSTVTSGTVSVPTTLLNMDPQSGAAITRWTAPSTGLFTITGSFQGDDTSESSHPVEIVLDGGTVLFGPSTISSFGQVVSFSLTENLTAGDTLDFIAMAGSSATNSSTGFDATIKTVVVSQPLILDVGTTANPVPAGATIQLYRTQYSPTTGLPVAGTTVLVNTLTSTTGGVVRVPDINQSIPALLETPGPVIPDGTYVYTDVLTDQAGNVSQPSPASPVITIDTAILVAPPPTLAPSSDSGLPVAQRDSDDITNIALSTFQGTVGPNAVVTLMVGVGTSLKAAGTTTADAAGNYAITTKVPLVSGLNNVEIVETDEAGNVTLPSTPLVVRLDTTVPPSITPTLASFSDTGTFSNDTITATTTPTFTGNATPWQFLSANPTPQNNGTLVQIYLQLVNPTPTPTIPPTPTPTPVLENPVFLAGEALADPVTGLYNVTVGQFVNPLPAGDVDATATASLGTGTASGTVGGFTIVNGGSGYTSANPPTVTLIGGGGSNTGFISATAVATVSGGVVTGITIVTPGSGYLTAPTVLISSPNLPSLAPGVYNVTAIQYDVAGNSSRPLTYGSPGAIVIDGTAADAANSGDNLGPGGTNEGGWLYMQQVLQLIQPNVADSQKTLVALGPDPRLGLTTGAAAAIASAFAQSTLPGLGWSLDYVVGPSNINAFLNGQPAVAYSSTGTPISGETLDSNGNLVSGGATLGDTGLLYIPTVDEAADDMTDADLAVVNADGLQIANYVNGGGGLYAQAEAPTLATATATATATINNTSGTISTIAVTGGGAGYTTVPAVTLTGGGFTTPATATAVLTGGVVTSITFSGGTGYISAPTVTIAPPPAGITPWGWLINTVPVTAPPLAVVNTGPSGVTPLNIKITAAGQTTFPTLQVANITTGPWQNYFTGVVSPLSVVATEDSPSGTARSLILTSAKVAVKANTVTINTTPAAAPPTPVLALSSETGPFNNDNITKDNNSTAKPSNAPVFDVGTAATSTTLAPNPVPPNTVVQLYRTQVDPTTGLTIPNTTVLVNMVTTTAGGVVAISDINQTNPSLLPTPGPLIPDGTYLYQAVVVSVAGVPSVMSPGLVVTIVATPPVAPAPILAPTSDTGLPVVPRDSDDITDNASPIFIGTVEPGATVALFVGGKAAGTTIANGTATAVASINSGGMVSGLTITNGGAGYSSLTLPTITIGAPAAGGTQATGVPVVSVNDVITGITVTNPGSGYTSPPTVTIEPPMGQLGAYSITTTLPLTSGLNSVTIVETDLAGNPSTTSPALTVRLDTTPPPAITPTLASTNNGGVTDQNTPTFTGTAEVWPFLSPNPTPLTDGSLVQIYLQPVVAAGQSPAPQFLAGEALANPLTGAYSVTVGQFVNPLPAGDVDATAGAVTITGGGMVTAIAVAGGGSGYASGTVTGITLTNGGSGYTSAPTVMISGGGGGSGAAATAVLTNGVITAIDITSAGSGYTSDPTITIASGGVEGGGGSGAVATAQVGPLPTVTLLGGGSGTGFVPATAVAVVTNGVVTGIMVTNPGSGYSTAPTVLIASPNLPVLPDGSYDATAIQYDVAGNASQAVQFGNTGAVVIDGTDSPNHGDANGPGGTNENAWLYMQEVLNVIEPHITATSKTLVVLGADPAITSGSGRGGTGGTGQGLVVPAISSAFAQSNLPKDGWNIVFVVGAADMESYLSGLPTETFNASDQLLGTTVSLGSTGFLYIPTANHLADDIKDPELAELDLAGPTIKAYVNSGGGLYAETENPSGAANAPVPFGWLISVFPGLQAVQANGGTVGLAITPQAAQIFPAPNNLTVADFTGTQWHNYFTGNFAGLGLTVAVTAFPGSNTQGGGFGSGSGGGGGSTTPTGVAEPLVLASTGGASATKPLQVTILTTPPATPPAPVLAASSDTGASDSDDITQDDNSTLFPAPVFDVGSAAMATAAATVTSGVVTTIAIVSGGSGYTSVPTVTLSGGGGTGASAIAIVTGGVVTGITITSGGTNYASNPTVTISNPTSNAFVEVGATVELFRTQVNPTTGALIPNTTVLANMLTNTAGGIVAIADVNLGEATTTTPSPVIPDGKYVYTAMVIDLAGNPSQISPASNVVTIDTSTPPTLPQPALLTNTGASSSNDVTNANNSATAAVATATINSQGMVIAIAVTSGGSGYSSVPTAAPSVTFSGGGGGSGAAATAVVTNGVVTAINITNAGSGYTSAPTVVIGSPPSNAPVFDAFNVLPNATVVLYRNNQEVSRVDLTAGGTVQIADLNGSTQPGQNPIPDGVYVYRVQQIDAAGNPSALSSPLTVTIEHTAPVTPFPPVLEASSDTSNGFDVTSKNNSSSSNAPVFDVAQIVPNASVILYRAPVVTTPATASATVSGGMVTTIAVATLSGITIITGGSGYTTAPTVMISGGGGTGATATAVETNGTVTAINITNSGTGYTSAPTVTFTGSGSGASATAQIISGGAGYVFTPTVTLSGGGGTGATASATVTNGVVTAITVTNAGTGYTSAPTVTFSSMGAFTQVNEVTSTAGGTVAIPDINNGQGAIPDGSYVYEAQQVDIAGNASLITTPSTTITISTATLAAPMAPVLDPNSDTGVSNSDGITRITLSAFPIFDISGVEGLATVQLFRLAPGASTPVLVGSLVAPQSSTPLTVMIADTSSPTPDGTYEYTADQINKAGTKSLISAETPVVYDTAQPPTPSAPTLDPASETGGNNPPTTSVTAPTFDVNVAVSGAEVDSALTLLRDGQVVAQSPYTITSTTGTVQITDPGPVSDGTHTYQVFLTDLAGNKSALSKSLTVTFAPDAPSAPVLAPASQSSGIAGSNVTSFTTNLVFTVATAGAKNNVELFRAPASAPASTTLINTIKGPGSITDPGPLLPGTYIYTARQVDSSNTVSLPSAPLDVTIVTTATAPTRVRLDPSSDSGIKGDDLTNATGSLVLDVFGVSAGTTILLFQNSSQVSKLTTADATGTATITGGTLAGIAVNSGGAGYVFTPTVTISGGGGSGAAATAVLTNGVVTGFTITTPGSGYTAVPTITVAAPIATAMVTATISSSGGGGGGGGTGGSGTGGTVSGFVITNGGSGYTSVPTVTISGGGGSGATASATVTNGVVTAITITSAGTGYTSAPTVTIAAPVGEVAITAPGPFTPNSYQFAAEQEDGAGNISALSPSVTIQVVTAGTVPTLMLSPGSDSGTPGEDITNVNGSNGIFPQFNVGNVVAGATLTLLRNGVVVNTLTNATVGTDVIGDQGVPPGAVIPDGTYQYTVQQLDNVGNTATSAPVAVQIVTSTSAPSTPVLQAPSGTGPNITSVRDPQFSVSGVPAGATLSLLRNGVVVSSVLSPGGGTVTIGDPGPLTDGQYTYSASLVDGAGNQSPPGGSVAISIVTVQGDYTDSGYTDLAVFDRASPNVLDTYIAGGITPPGGSNAFGSGALDIPFQGDLDGDGKTDLILYRPSTSQWFVQESSGGFQVFNFGAPGDIPVVGDFDGVGHDELAVYQPSTSQWFVAGHAGVFATFGGPTDIPVALRNYYGTGQDVLAVFRPSTGQWFIAGQSSAINFGGAGDVPIPLFNYYGNGRDVLAVFRPSTSQWFVGGQASGISFGGAGDVPISGDFDGIGRDEIGVYQPSTGQWFVAGHGTAVATFGGPADIPLEAPYLYRVAGLSTAGIPAASLYAFDFGANAAALSAGSGGTVAAAAVTSSPSSTSTSAVASPAVPATTKHNKHTTASIVVAGAPAQTGSENLHDTAIAALQDVLGHRRKRRSSSRLT